MLPLIRMAFLAIFASLAVLPAEGGQTVTEAIITVSARPDKLDVEYRSHRSISALNLIPVKPGVRAGWSVQTVGVVLDGRTLRRADGATFNKVEVTFGADTRRIDRAYPQALHVGEGWLVHGPYLALTEGRSKVSLRLPPGWIALPRQPLSGHFFVGPRSYVRDGIVSPPNIPDGLRATAVVALHQGNLSYAQRFALAPPSPPLIILAVDPTLGKGWRGDSTTGALSLRFAEDGLREPPQRAAIGRFVAHELFHDWWKGVVAPLPDEKGAWVEEGMAEYAALLTSDEPAIVATELTRHLNNCRDSLAPDGLIAAPPTGGAAVYDCGVLFQWLRDLQQRRASNGHEDIFVNWRALLERHRRTGSEVEWQTAVAPLSAFTDDDAAKLILLPTEDRWPKIVTALNGLGARIVASRDDSDLRIAILRHLLSLVCRERMGFYTQAKSVKLDTGDRCGPLNGDPSIDQVAGHNLFEDAAGAFEAVASLCASGKPVVFQNGDNTVATLACSKQINPPSSRWTVKIWKPLG
jgi:hypothetical protein